MNSLFDRLADISLRRIYKFILKKLIGEFLNEELDIEQFVVESRVGLISINDLALNVERINDELTQNNGGIPLTFTVKTITVSSLRAKIQYSTILTEGISLHASGISVEVVPNTSVRTLVDCGGCDGEGGGKVPNKAQFMEGTGSMGTVRLPAAAVAPTESESMSDTDLSFIAEWVDVILSRLVVTVEDVRVTIFSKDPYTRHAGVGGDYVVSDRYARRGRREDQHRGGIGTSSSSSGVALQLSISLVTFHYTHPSDITSYTVAESTGSGPGQAQGGHRSVSFQLPGGGSQQPSQSQGTRKSGYDRARKGERRLLQVQKVCVRLLQLGGRGSQPTQGPKVQHVEVYTVVKETVLVRAVDFTAQLLQRLVAAPGATTSGTSGTEAISVANMSMSTAGAAASLVNDVEVSLGETVAAVLPLPDLAALLSLVNAYGAVASGDPAGVSGAASLSASYAVAPTVNTVTWLEKLCAQSSYPGARGALGGGLGLDSNERRLERLLQQVLWTVVAARHGLCDAYGLVCICARV